MNDHPNGRAVTRPSLERDVARQKERAPIAVNRLDCAAYKDA